MDLTVDEFISGLLRPETAEQPSDSVKPEQLVPEYPPWYDEKQFNKGRRFFWDHSFALTTSMFLGLVAVFAVPSILRVLVNSRRSSSLYTAYKRYLSTILHTMTWFEHELKPGSVSWRSLYAVRSRHIRAGLAAKLQDKGTVSQRDVALTQFGFCGFALLKPTKFGVIALHDDDWEAYNHFWRTIGYMIGLEDRYNICRKNIDETRQVLQILQDRVYTPCLESVPEYFEHMARVMIEGMWSVNPTVNSGAVLYQTKYLAGVPGYLYTEEERIAFQRTLKEKMTDKEQEYGIPVSALICEPAIEGVPNHPSRQIYYHDYNVFHQIPAYKSLTWYEKYKLNFNAVIMFLYQTFLGRWYFNLNYLWSIFLMKYCPYLAFFRFGIKKSYVDPFVEDPTDDTQPITNQEYERKLAEPVPWYRDVLNLFW